MTSKKVKHSALGRGLSALIPTAAEEEEKTAKKREKRAGQLLKRLLKRSQQRMGRKQMK